MQESFSSLKSKAAEIKAYIDENPPDVMTMDHYKYLMSEFTYLQRQIDNMWNALYQHTENGHLPPIDGAERLTKALKVLGLDGDYKVEKKTIYASDGTKEKMIWEIPLK